MVSACRVLDLCALTSVAVAKEVEGEGTGAHVVLQN